jgi:hypothetical protein
MTEPSRRIHIREFAKSLDPECASGHHDSKHPLEAAVCVSVGPKPDLYHFGLLGHDLQPQPVSAKLRLSDPKVPAECPFVAFNVEKPTIVVFELPLDQEVRFVTSGFAVK